MPTPLLTASARFTDQAVTKIYFIPSIAATSLAPTRTELNAGTDLSGEVHALKGWTVTAAQIVTEDLTNPFEAKIPGSTQAPDSSITFYTSKTGNDVRALLPRGTSGFIGMLDGGDVTGNKMEVYPVTVTSNGVQRSVDGKAASMVEVMFAITRTPGQNISVP